MTSVQKASCRSRVITANRALRSWSTFVWYAQPRWSSRSVVGYCDWRKLSIICNPSRGVIPLPLPEELHTANTYFSQRSPFIAKAYVSFDPVPRKSRLREEDPCLPEWPRGLIPREMDVYSLALRIMPRDPSPLKEVGPVPPASVHPRDGPFTTCTLWGGPPRYHDRFVGSPPPRGYLSQGGCSPPDRFTKVNFFFAKILFKGMK